MNTNKHVTELAALCDKVAGYEAALLNRYGALVYGHDLWKVIGYPTSNAFRQSVKRKTVPVKTFKREGYRMRFARTHDIAVWLAAMDHQKNQEASHE